jgi:tetratricopeptide (TPR) repeat protein
VGFILYRKSEKVTALFTAWAELTAQYFGLASRERVPDIDCLPHIADPELRRKLLFMDQTSFVQLISPEVNRFGLEMKILDESWNFRGAAPGRKLDQPLKIDHQPALRNVLGRDLINVALRYQASGGGKRAIDILQALLARAPNDTGLMKIIANCYMHSGAFEQAGRIISRGLEINPGDTDLQAAFSAVRARADK